MNAISYIETTHPVKLAIPTPRSTRLFGKKA